MTSANRRLKNAHSFGNDVMSCVRFIPSRFVSVQKSFFRSGTGRTFSRQPLGVMLENSNMDDRQKEILSSIIIDHYSLAGASLKVIIDNCKARNLKKEDYLTKEGKPNSYEYFLLDGIIHRNIFNEDGECITTGFHLSKTVLTPHFARTIKGNSIFNLQALTDTCLAEIPVSVLDSLRYSFEDIRYFGLKVLEKELLKSIHNEISFRAMTAKDRLLAFRNDYPNLENIIPHTIIASYLGITPVSFSRLRNELAKY